MQSLLHLNFGKPMKPYPFKFSPIAQERIWGGNKLNTILNKAFDGDQIGESWEISGVTKKPTRVANGSLKGKTLQELITLFKSDLVGKKVYDAFGSAFPLLIKFIDAKAPLSIQVHPNDEVAKSRHNSFGKNEMWYILEAEKEAEITFGFNTSLNPTSFSTHLNEETLQEVLNKERVTAGDAFFIPTGLVHAIGGGILLAEIQQTSDITYRIFDYNRIDKQTNEKRPLHHDLAKDVVDFSSPKKQKIHPKPELNQTQQLIHTPYFKSNTLRLNQEIKKDYSPLDSFVIYICTAGELKIKCDGLTYPLQKGETLLLPALTSNVALVPKQQAEILEVYF